MPKYIAVIEDNAEVIEAKDRDEAEQIAREMWLEQVNDEDWYVEEATKENWYVEEATKENLESWDFEVSDED